MTLLQAALRKEWLMKTLAYAILFLAGVAMIYYGFDTKIILALLGLFFIGISLGLLITHLQKRRVEDNYLMVLLKERPRHIVWVYAMVVERMPFGFQFSKDVTLYFKLVDGDDISVSLPESELQMVLTMLNKRLPHATFGFSADKEQWFMAAPELLYNDDDEQQLP